MRTDLPVIRCCLLCLVLLFSFDALAEKAVPLAAPEPRFRNFSSAQGLPSSETYFVHQDKKGYIWITTDRGVVRYDGYRFRVFTKKDGLADNVVFKIYEDSKQRLWFLTRNNFLSYYENGKIHLYKYNNKIAKLVGEDQFTIKDLYVSPDGSILYQLGSKGRFRIDAHGNVDQRKFNFDSNTFAIHKIAGEYHVEYKGIYEYAISKELEPVDAYLYDESGKHFLGPHAPAIDTRFTQARGFLYMLCGRSVYCINKAKKLRLLPSVSIIAIYGCGNDLWVGDAQGGVTRYAVSADSGKLLKKETFLNSYAVSGILRDREGGFWFTTLDNGVYYASNLSIKNLTRRQGLIPNNPISVGGVGNRVLVINGLGMYHELNFPWLSSDVVHPIHPYKCPRFGNELLLPFRPVKQLSDDVAYRLLQISCENCPSKKGLLFVDRTDISLLQPDGKVVELFKLWDKNSFNRYVISSLLEGVEGTVFYGRNGGVFKVRQKKSFPVGGNNPVFRKEVTDMAAHPEWNNIVGTKDTGVYCFSGDHITWHFTEKNGLLSDVVNKLFMDERGRLWIATNKGVSVVYFENGKRTFTNLTAAKGLISNEVNDVYVYGDTAWILTKKGISVLPVAENLRRKASGGLFLEYIATADRYFDELTTSFELKHRESFVRIVFGTPDFSSSPGHEFRYRTQTDGAWVHSSLHEIVLLNPPAGDYAMEVSYRNEDGKWSGPRVLCRFSVAPAFYATWYFITGMALLGLGLAFLLFRLRIRQLSRRHQLQKTINQLEQKALRAQMNPHFIFNSLNSIQSFLIFEENEKAERYLLKFAHLIRQTLNNSRESYITIEAEMETLKRYLDLEQMRFKDKFEFEISCLLSPDELKYGVPPMLIQPYVENAVLHGFHSVETGGKIEVVFESLKNNRLLCTVEDNGVGRKVAGKFRRDGHQSFGTKITAERLEAFREKYGDDFTIMIIDKEESGVACGTKVVIQIPVVLPGEMGSSEVD